MGFTYKKLAQFKLIGIFCLTAICLIFLSLTEKQCFHASRNCCLGCKTTNLNN